VAQMQDAFEQNAVVSLLGAQYDYVICGTRFDPSAALWNTADTAAPFGDIEAPAAAADASEAAVPEVCSLVDSDRDCSHAHAPSLWFVPPT
jgi:hypothetical protein